MNTMQFEFDAVVAHLYAQGRPALDRRAYGPACYYRTPDRKLSCAVGCRIPDEKYNPQMDVSTEDDGTGVHNLIVHFRDVLPPEIPAYEQMFEALQSVHDGCYLTSDGSFYLDKLASRLRKVADEFNLTFTVPSAAHR